MQGVVVEQPLSKEQNMNKGCKWVLAENIIEMWPSSCHHSLEFLTLGPLPKQIYELGRSGGWSMQGFIAKKGKMALSCALWFSRYDFNEEAVPYSLLLFRQITKIFCPPQRMKSHPFKATLPSLSGSKLTALRSSKKSLQPQQRTWSRGVGATCLPSYSVASNSRRTLYLLRNATSEISQLKKKRLNVITKSQLQGVR